MAAAPLLEPAGAAVVSHFPMRVGAASGAIGGAAKRRPLRATDTVDNAPATILVVEPDERTRSLLNAGLIKEGFRVIAAASAEEALRYLAPDRALPSMVFCEADLRGGDGFGLCGQIRADQRTSDLPVVLLSRSAESFHRELAGGAGADQYLPKPLFLNDVAALARLMAGKSSSFARYDAETDRLPISQVMRALLSGVRSGRLELTGAGGWITFREGQIVDASYDALRGEEALNRLLLMGRGGYVVTFGPALTRATLSLGLPEYCARTLPRLRRWEALLSRSVPLDAVLVVQFPKLLAHLTELPDEVNGLVRLCDGFRTVRAVVQDSLVDEVTALEALTRLYAMGVIEPQAPAAQEAAEVPAFFEPEEAGAVPADGVAEVTRALDEELLLQLEAFRIKPVIEDREKKPTPVPLVHFAKEEREEDALDSLAALGPQVEEATADWDVEEQFYVQGEVTKDLTPHVKPPRSLKTILAAAAVVVAAAGAYTLVTTWNRAESPVAEAPGHPVQPERRAEGPESKARGSGNHHPASTTALRAYAQPDRGDPAQPEITLAPITVTLDASPVPAPLTRAISLYEAGRYRQAGSLLEEIANADPTLTQAWLFLGLARYDAGQSVDAEAAAKQALRLEPDNGRALMLLATIHLDSGAEQQARAELRRYLKSHPKGPFAADARLLLGQ